MGVDINEKSHACFVSVDIRPRCLGEEMTSRLLSNI